MSKLQKLTDDQRAFAEQHHELVPNYLRMRGLDVDEYYDIVIFRYLHAVQRYSENLKLQQYAFPTIAFQGMRSALNHYFRSQSRQQKKFVLYSLDAPIGNGSMLSECVSSPDPSVHEYSEAREEWNNLKGLMTPKQVQALAMRAAGYTNREIGRVYRIHPDSVSGRMSRLRKKVCCTAA